MTVNCSSSHTNHAVWDAGELTLWQVHCRVSDKQLQYNSTAWSTELQNVSLPSCYSHTGSQFPVESVPWTTQFLLALSLFLFFWFFSKFILHPGLCVPLQIVRCMCTHIFHIPLCFKKSQGEHSFSYFGPATWNKLPVSPGSHNKPERLFFISTDYWSIVSQEECMCVRACHQHVSNYNGMVSPHSVLGQGVGVQALPLQPQVGLCCPEVGNAWVFVFAIMKVKKDLIYQRLQPNLDEELQLVKLHSHGQCCQDKFINLFISLWIHCNCVSLISNLWWMTVICISLAIKFIQCFVFVRTHTCKKCADSPK